MAEWEVRLPASGRDAEHELAVHSGGVGRRKIMRQDDGSGIEIAQLGIDLALEIAQDAAGDIEEITGAFPEIIVVEFAHFPRVGTDDLLVGEVDIDEAAHQLLLHRFDQRGVFEQKQMRVEDTGVRLTNGAGQFVADDLDLLACLEQRGLEAGDFTSHILGANATLADDVLIRIEENERPRWRCPEIREYPYIFLLLWALGYPIAHLASGPNCLLFVKFASY